MEKIDRIKLSICAMGEVILPYIHFSIIKKNGQVSIVPLNSGIDFEEFGLNIKIIEDDTKHGTKFIEGYAFLKNNFVWVNIDGKEVQSVIDKAMLDELLENE